MSRFGLRAPINYTTPQGGYASSDWNDPTVQQRQAAYGHAPSAPQPMQAPRSPSFANPNRQFSVSPRDNPFGPGVAQPGMQQPFQTVGQMTAQDTPNIPMAMPRLVPGSTPGSVASPVSFGGQASASPSGQTQQVSKDDYQRAARYHSVLSKRLEALKPAPGQAPSKEFTDAQAELLQVEAMLKPSGIGQQQASPAATQPSAQAEAAPRAPIQVDPFHRQDAVKGMYDSHNAALNSDMQKKMRMEAMGVTNDPQTNALGQGLYYASPQSSHADTRKYEPAPSPQPAVSGSPTITGQYVTPGTEQSYAGESFAQGQRQAQAQGQNSNPVKYGRDANGQTAKYELVNGAWVKAQ